MRVRNNSPMGKKQNSGDQSGGRNQSRHKSKKMVRIRKAFADILDELGEETTDTPTQMVNEAVREWLERRGRWPPKPRPKP